MNDYTMTFKYDGDFDLPDSEAALKRRVPKMVLEKLMHHEFELVDFNLTENYGNGYAANYISNPSRNRSIVEIKLALEKEHLKSRETIYNRCLAAMRKGELALAFACENEDKDKGLWQSIIIFDMKEKLKNAAIKPKKQ